MKVLLGVLVVAAMVCSAILIGGCHERTYVTASPYDGPEYYGPYDDGYYYPYDYPYDYPYGYDYGGVFIGGDGHRHFGHHEFSHGSVHSGATVHSGGGGHGEHHH